MLVGCGMWAYVLGAITAKVSSLNVETAAFREQMDSLRAFCKARARAAADHRASRRATRTVTDGRDDDEGETSTTRAGHPHWNRRPPVVRPRDGSDSRRAAPPPPLVPRRPAAMTKETSTRE